MSDTATATAEETRIPVGRPVQDIIADLTKPIADRHLETRSQGGTVLTYISWHNAVRYLDLYAPGWCYEITKIHTDERRIYLTARITVPCEEGLIYREATGTEELNTSSWGDPSSKAESMALRRAAAKWGLGLYLYDHATNGPVPVANSAARQNSPANSQNPQAPRNFQTPTVGEITVPIASNFNDLITAKQLGMARALCHELDLDVDDECQSVFKCDAGKMSKKAASAFIQHLRDLQQQNGGGEKGPWRQVI
jgi:hypothetical protein